MTDLADRAEYTLDEVVELAIEYLGDDADRYKQFAFIKWMTGKARDAVRYAPTVDERQQTFDNMPVPINRRIAVKQEDGSFLYVALGTMFWPTMVTIQDQRRDLELRRTSGSDDWDKLMRHVAPVMAVDESVTLLDALRQLGPPPT